MARPGNHQDERPLLGRELFRGRLLGPKDALVVTFDPPTSPGFRVILGT